MLFHDNVVAYGKPQPGSLAGRLGREERVEHFLLHSGRDAGPIVADANFNIFATVPRPSAQHGAPSFWRVTPCLPRKVELPSDRRTADRSKGVRPNNPQAASRCMTLFNSRAKPSARVFLILCRGIAGVPNFSRTAGPTTCPPCGAAAFTFLPGLVLSRLVTPPVSCAG
jgi:hypothetical protein